MAETTDDVRRDIELTRERMTSTLSQLEQKMNLSQVVKDHPWPAIAMAVGAGILLSGSRADVRATAATLAATRGTSSRLGPVLDDLVAQLMTGVQQAFQSRVEGWVGEIKGAIGAPAGGQQTAPGQQPQDGRSQFADVTYGGGSPPSTASAGASSIGGSAGGSMSGSQAGSQGFGASSSGSASSSGTSNTIDASGNFGRAD